MKKLPLTHRTLALVAAASLAIGLATVTGSAQAAPTPLASRTLAGMVAATTPTPTNLRAIDATRTSITVGWNEPAGATRYRLDYADNPEMTNFGSKWTRTNTVTLSELQASSSRWVRVRVVEMNGRRKVGPWSGTVKVTTAGATLFGANYTTAAMVDESIYQNRAEVARIFFQQLDTAQWSRHGAVSEATADGVKTFVISWKETDQSAIRTFLAGIPDGLKVYTTFNHEPEDDHGSPGSAEYRAWSTEYKRQWSLQAPLMRAEGFIPTNILMAWTLDPKSGRNVADWTPPAGTFDVFAFDAYYGQGKDPATLVNRMTAAAGATGVGRTGLAETGAPASDPNRVESTHAMKAAILESGMFEWGIYWNSAESSGYDSRMDAATADAWFN